MKKILQLYILLKLIKNWEFIEQNGMQIYQIFYKDFNKFVASNTHKAVMEIKKGTPSDFMEHIVEYFGDYFVFLQRIDEDEIPHGGITIFPPGQFDYKIKFIRHFKPYNTNVQDIINELLKITEDLSQKIQLVQLSEIVKDDIKDKQIPVLLVAENSEHLGYRFIPYAHKIRKLFKFYYLQDDVDIIQQQYKIETLPAILVFNEIEIEGIKKIKVAPYIEEMTFSKLEKFLFQIYDLHYEEKDAMRHDGLVFEYTTNLDPKLNFCFNKNCLLIFIDRSKEDPLLQKSLTIAKNVKKHFDSSDLAVYLINGICHKNLMMDIRLDPQDLPQVILYDKSKNRYFFYPFELDMQTLVDFVRRAEQESIQAQQLTAQLIIEYTKCDEENYEKFNEL